MSQADAVFTLRLHVTSGLQPLALAALCRDLARDIKRRLASAHSGAAYHPRLCHLEFDQGQPAKAGEPSPLDLQNEDLEEFVDGLLVDVADGHYGFRGTVDRQVLSASHIRYKDSRLRAAWADLVFPSLRVDPAYLALPVELTIGLEAT